MGWTFSGDSGLEAEAFVLQPRPLPDGPLRGPALAAFEGAF